MQNSKLLSLQTGFIFVIIAGCSFEINAPPRNADPKEKEAVAFLKPICENISWNENGRVRTLDIGGDQTNDDSVKFVAKLSELEELSFFGSQISDNGLVHLKALKQLKALSLAHTAVTDNGIMHLKDIQSLVLLDLNNTGITDQGLKYLAQFPSLNRLFIANTKVTSRGVKELQAALPNCVIQRS